MFARQVKAAEDAVTGTLATVCQEMANVPFPNGIRPTQPFVSPAAAAAMGKAAEKVTRATATTTVSPQAQTDN